MALRKELRPITDDLVPLKTFPTLKRFNPQEKQPRITNPRRAADAVRRGWAINGPYINFHNVVVLAERLGLSTIVKMAGDSIRTDFIKTHFLVDLSSETIDYTAVRKELQRRKSQFRNALTIAEAEGAAVLQDPRSAARLNQLGVNPQEISIERVIRALENRRKQK